jgi:hypothetical protein
MTQADLDLLHDFVADRIATEDFLRLESLLRSNAAARRAVRGLTAVEEGLEQFAATALSRRFFGPDSDGPSAASQSAASVAPQATVARMIGDAFAALVGLLRESHGLLRVVLPAAGTVAALCLVLVAWRMLAVPARRSLPDGVPAQIVAMSGPVWVADAPARHEGDSLQAGGLLALERGLAEIFFASGATVVLEGPAVFEIVDGGTGKLGRGRLAATLDQPTGPFSIHTPSAVITDRGTQFGVEVDAAGKTEVRVFAGLVELAAIATLGTVTPISLSAGDSGEVDSTGGISRVAAPAAKKFVMAVPKPLKPVPPPPLPFAWDDSRAEVLFADSFAGPGILEGSAPADRGTGAARWIGPQEGWRLAAETRSLEVTATGAAFLPFKPEPGHVYRLAVTMNVKSGGIGWAAIGFAAAANTRLATLDHAWMLQRHDAKSQANLAYKGPQLDGAVSRGDPLSGEQRRTVVLDTTGPRWKAFFLAGETVVGQCSYDLPPDQISHVAISVFPNTVVSFRDFSLRAIRTIR